MHLTTHKKSSPKVIATQLQRNFLQVQGKMFEVMLLRPITRNGTSDDSATIYLRLGKDLVSLEWVSVTRQANGDASERERSRERQDVFWTQHGGEKKQEFVPIETLILSQRIFYVK